MPIKNSPKIVFFGTPDFAVASLKALIDHQFNVVAIVTAPDKPAGRGKKLKSSAVKEYAVSLNIPLLQPEKLKDAAFLQELRRLDADLQVIVAFRMLPEIVWSMPPMGTINVHASLLPQYRGAAPINWAIIKGEEQTGVTTFKLRHEIDTGPILLQRRVEVQASDDAGSLYQKLMNEGAGLLVATIDGLINNTISEKEQIFDGEIKHAPKIFKDTCNIDWNQPAADIHNLIRGLSPYPAAFTTLGEKQLKIFKSSVEIDRHQLQAGRHETDHKTFFRFAANDGWINCLEVQYEGKKRMNIEDFLRGWRST